MIDPADLRALPPAWRLCRVGPDKRPAGGANWYDLDRHSPSEALALNGSGPPAWGLLCGTASGGVLVIDLDDAGWDAAFLALTSHPITELPATIGWTSGRPGRSAHAFQVPPHWWAQLPQRLFRSNDAGTVALEFRWDRHQSVILGAHPETDGYRWLPGRSPRDIAPATAPEWLLAAIVNAGNITPAAPLLDLIDISGTPPPPDPAPAVGPQVVELLSFVSAAHKALIDSGSVAGACNDDGIELALDLVATEEWLLTQGVRPDISARDAFALYISRCPGVINGKPFNVAAAWRRFDGAAARNPHPSTPPQKLASRLAWALRQQQLANGLPGASGAAGGPSTAPSAPSPEAETLPTYRELLAACLDAVRSGDEDREMTIRAELMNRFRRKDEKITAALFRLLTEQETAGRASPATPRDSLDLAAIEGMDSLLDGFLPANDLTLLYAAKGAGKTLAALALAFSVIDGAGFLDHSCPADPGSVLFIASDSGAIPLKAALQDLGLADHPATQGGPAQRFYAWAHDASQGMDAWGATFAGCVRLLDFVKRKDIRLVVIDSAKAICSAAALSYMDNETVAGLLTFIKETICLHAAVLIISHDGTAHGSHSGAKSWAEIPSVVHNIDIIPNTPGERIWRVVKNRMGPLREFRYELSHDGILTPVEGVETIADASTAVLQVLVEAAARGIQSLSRRDLVAEIGTRFQYSAGTIDNTLGRMVRGRHPDVIRVSAPRGHYKIAPRHSDRLKAGLTSPAGFSVRGLSIKVNEEGKKPVVDRDLPSSLACELGTQDVNSADGSSSHPLTEFTSENPSNSSDTSRSAPVHSHGDRDTPKGQPETPPQPAGPKTTEPPWLTRLIELRRTSPNMHPAALALRLDPDGTGTPTGRQVAAALAQLSQPTGTGIELP